MKSAFMTIIYNDQRLKPELEFEKRSIPQFPHCDAKVLHAPNICEFCDRHPDWQELRILWGIAFTGENLPDLIPCPSERDRPLNNINRWPGNRPYTKYTK